MPAILGFRATASLLRSLLSSTTTPRPHPFFSPQTLALLPMAAAPPNSVAAADSPPLVGLPPIPRAGSISSLSSAHSPPHPTSSLTALGRRREPRSDATKRRCAAASPPFPAVRAPGEAHRQRLHPMRAFPSLLWPRLAAPPCSVASVSRMILVIPKSAALSKL